MDQSYIQLQVKEVKCAFGDVHINYPYFHAPAFQQVSLKTACQTPGFACFLIHPPRRELKMEGRKGERGIKEQEITQTPADVKRAKGGGGHTRPRRETAPVRLKRGSQQGGGRSLHEDLFQISLCVSRVSCNKLLTTATLWDLQLVCGSYPLTPYLIDSKSLSYTISASDAYGTGSWTQSHTHAPEQMPCILMQAPICARKLVNHLYTGRKSLFVVSANSLLPRIDRPRWFDDALRSPWTQTLNV